MTGYRGNNYSSYDILITASASGSVWGCGTYTDDSSIAAAATHYYGLSSGTQYVVRVRVVPGLSSYSSCLSGGITSSSYGIWPGSYDFQGRWSPSAMSLSTSSASNLAGSSATVGATLSGNGEGSGSTALYVCYNTTGSPTWSDAKAYAGSGTAVFSGTATLTGLTPGATYYARACAQNSLGQIGYGGQVSFFSCNAIANCNAVTCSNSSNQTCTDCAAGYYELGQTCASCATCPAGQYASAACTETSNTVCAS